MKEELNFMSNKENNNNDMLIKQNLFVINRSLIMYQQFFRDWDEYQQYFKEALDSGVLRIKDASSFAWSLYSNNPICLTTTEDENLSKKKNGIINFMKKISDSDYIKEHSITSENMGSLYEQELTKATAPEVIENNTSYAKRSANR